MNSLTVRARHRYNKFRSDVNFFSFLSSNPRNFVELARIGHFYDGVILLPRPECRQWSLLLG